MLDDPFYRFTNHAVLLVLMWYTSFTAWKTSKEQLNVYLGMSTRELNVPMVVAFMESFSLTYCSIFMTPYGLPGSRPDWPLEIGVFSVVGAPSFRRICISILLAVLG